jgi:hypothetical protein
VQISIGLRNAACLCAIAAATLAIRWKLIMKRINADVALSAVIWSMCTLKRMRDSACRKRQRHTEGHSLKTSAQLANRGSLSVLDVWLFLCAELLSLTPLEVYAMYELTLTLSERKAIDWVGNRYSNGADLFSALQDCSSSSAHGEDEDAWDTDGDITFHVPEHVAWKITENAANEDGYWPCFSPELAEKMQRFVDAIV